MAVNPVDDGLAVLAVITLLNLRGLGDAARGVPAAHDGFIVGLLAILAIGLLHPLALHAAPLSRSLLPARAMEPVGLLLLLKAFSAGCSALTGVEAIANGVPLFKPPRVRRAKRTELLLGVILSAMLLGVATLAGRCSRWRPTPPSAACRCWPACWRGTLLVAVGGNTLTLIPLYAIGVFTGFTLSQGGLVVHWRRTRPPRWRYRASLNGLGAAVTAVATVVFLATKFTDSAWAVVLALPAFIMLFTRIHRYYDQAGRALGIGGIPGKPHARPAAVVVPVTGVSRLAQCGISAALSISEHVEAVTVARSGAAEESERVRELQRQWTRWNPGVPQAALPVPCTTTSTWSSPGSCGTGRTSSSPASRCGCSSTAVPRR